MDNVGALLGIQAQIRSICCQCGSELRVDLAELVAKYGPAGTLVDRLERCRVVGCAGSTYYRAARTTGRPWTTLVRDPHLLETVVAITPAGRGHPD